MTNDPFYRTAEAPHGYCEWCGEPFKSEIEAQCAPFAIAGFMHYACHAEWMEATGEIQP